MTRKRSMEREIRERLDDLGLGFGLEISEDCEPEDLEELAVRTRELQGLARQRRKRGQPLGNHRDAAGLAREILGEDSICMWQITPRELPEDLAPMALELWRNGAEHALIQVHVEDRTSEAWWEKIRGVSPYVLGEVGLLAAASDLLEALEGLADIVDPADDVPEPYFREPLAKARAAIAKARR